MSGQGVVESLDQFAFLMAEWHNRTMAGMAQIAKVPEGQPVTVQLDEAKEAEDFILSDDLHKGFIIGITVAMAMFQDLPFKAVPDTSANDDGSAPT